MQEQLGHGRLGSVYSVAINDGNDCLPPLVIKVTAWRRTENLANEAWFYKEMECIQGASIALCYGYFESEVDPNSEVLDCAMSDEMYHEEMEGLEYEESGSENEYEYEHEGDVDISILTPIRRQVYDVSTTDLSCA